MKKWTIMVYLAGDNNLSEDMIWSLIGMRDAMRAKNSDESINLVAIYDSGYPTVPVREYHFNNENSLSKLAEIAELPGQGNYNDSGRKAKSTKDSANIIDFVSNAVSKYKAENYALIMSGHSDGILGKTMFYDSNPESQIVLHYLRNILRVAKKCLKSNKDNFDEKEPKFNLIGFDSCMMGMLEVGYELRDVAEYMVASQGYSPTDGWNYQEILTDLIEKKGNLSPEEFADLIVNKQITYSYDYNAGGRSMCLSSVKLSEAANLRKSINSLGKFLNEILKTPVYEKNQVDENDAIIRESIKNLIHDSHYFSQSFLHEQAVDILDFVKNLSACCDLKVKELEIMTGKLPSEKGSNAEKFKNKLARIKKECEKIEKAMSSYRINKRSSGPEYQFSEGASVFFPWTLLAYNMVYHNYTQLEFSRKSGWNDFIKIFAERTLRAKNQPRFGDTGAGSYGDWIFAVDSANKAETAKAETAKAETAKAETAKGGDENFYKYFRRFRNHPIHHDVEKK